VADSDCDESDSKGYERFHEHGNEWNGYGLEKPIAIYYEHPDWFRPLFQQLDERGLPWLKIDARHHNYDVAHRSENIRCFSIA